MILLDTNVVSETFRPSPNPRIVDWLDAQPEHSLFLCTPVLAELHYGLERMPPGKRKDLLHSAIEALETDLYRDRILVLDVAAAREYARLAARRSAAGKPLGQMDALIAAIAVSNGLRIATRNVAHFSDLPVEVVNPFDPSLSVR